MKSNFNKSINLLLLIVLCFSIESNAKTNIYEEGKLYRHKLDNGLVVLTMERHIAPLIYHQLTYKVGARNEKLGYTGISHIVEHMMFKGTQKFKKGDVSKLISLNSGMFNAFTMRDMTSYYEYMPANKIELAMDIESDRMMNSIFDPDEFKPEVEVIKQERRMRVESNAQGVFSEALYNIAYQSHPNQNPVIGWPNDLDNITRNQAYDYYQKYYTPNNAFLVLVGDFNTEDIIKLTEKYYGGIPKGPELKEESLYEEEQLVEKSFKYTHNDFQFPILTMSFHIPVYTHKDIAALKVGTKILCEKSRTSRLYKLLVENEKIATTVAGGFGITKDPGLFRISVTVKADSLIEKTKGLILNEIALMQNEDISDYELEKTKNRFKFAEVQSGVKNVELGRRISMFEAYYGWESYDKYINSVKTVSKEDIKDVMKKYLLTTNLTVGIMMPKEGETDGQNRKPINIEDLDEEGNSFYYKNPCPFDDLPLITEDDFEDIIYPKKIAPLIKEAKLSNGIKVYTIENHLVPSISCAGYINTGMIEETFQGAQPGITDLLASVMNRGTEKDDYETLSERMSFIPISFGVNGGLKGLSFMGNSLIENKDEMFNTGFEILTMPRLDKKDIEMIKSKNIPKIEKRLSSTGMKAFYYMYDTIYKEHPFSTSVPEVESFKKITREDLIGIHKKYFRPELTSLLIVGDMSHSEMVATAEKHFGKWKNNNQPVTPIEMPTTLPLKGRVIKVFKDNDYKQCTINIGFAPVNNILPEDEESVNILNYILASSALTSRIGLELRDKQGWIYGLKSELHSQTTGIGYWKLNTKTSVENTANVIKGIFEQIDLLENNGVSDEELKNAKNHLLGLLPFYVETPDDIANIVINTIIRNEPLDNYDKTAERIISVTKEDVVKMAEKYLQKDNCVIVVDGPIEENSLDYLIEAL
ncbi:MAG: insulinase family protein [Bacteroidetes bacterium]|nr:insulinase family protein [Bacteroidota bacterium]